MSHLTSLVAWVAAGGAETAASAASSLQKAGDEASGRHESGGLKPHQRRASRGSFKVWWRVFLSIAVLLLAVHVCASSFNRLKQREALGTQARRLATSFGLLGDDFEKEEPADFKDLCLALGAWKPAEETPGHQRLSPLLVESFLASLEGGFEADSFDMATSSVNGSFNGGPQALSFAAKRPAAAEQAPGHQRLSPLLVESFLASLEGGFEADSFDMDTSSVNCSFNGGPQAFSFAAKRPAAAELVEDGESAAQPLAKVPRASTSSFSPPPPMFKPCFLPGHADPSAFRWGEAGQVTSQAVQLPLRHLPVEPFPQRREAERTDATWASPEQPSTSAESAAHAAVVAKAPHQRKHPYVHLPQLDFGVQPRDFVPERIWSTDFGALRPFPVLRKIRTLLRKDILLQQDADSLVECCEQVANHAFRYMSTELIGKPPHSVSNLLGRRFMVFNAIYSTSVALHADWPEQDWWEKLASRVPTECVYKKNSSPHATKFYTDLMADLSRALSLYKRGKSPTDEEVIGLKRRLSCMPTSPWMLKEDTHFVRKDQCSAAWRQGIAVGDFRRVIFVLTPQIPTRD
ncbi:hypothetical protein Efla_007294 [Eimeria flavescens]